MRTGGLIIWTGVAETVAFAAILGYFVFRGRGRAHPRGWSPAEEQRADENGQ